MAAEPALRTVLGFVFALWVTTPRKHSINKNTIDQVRIGQTVAESEALFGVPARNYARSHRLAFYAGPETAARTGTIPGGEELRAKGWTESARDQVGICVRLDENGAVTETRFGLVAEGAETVLDKMQRWLHP